MAKQNRQPPPVQLRPIQGRMPPSAIDAEKAVISTCLLKNRMIDDVARVLRRKDDWHVAAHRIVWSVIYETRMAGRPVDTVIVNQILKDRELIGQVGGAAYLAELVDATPAVANVLQHAGLVAETARKRRFLGEMQRLEAEGYGDTEEDWIGSSVRLLADLTDAKATRGSIRSSCLKVPVDWLTTPSPPRQWVLRHPTRNGEDCPPGYGDGLLPLGKAGMFVAGGGTGKTMALLQLAISVATGLPWLGYFDVSPDVVGRNVFLGLGEESAEECQRRLKDAAQVMKLDERQMLAVSECVTIAPLEGTPVALVAKAEDGVTVQETDEFREVKQILIEEAGPRGWGLVVIDPLSRWAGGDTETDNSAATRFVQTIESLTKAPGRPTVIVAHHTNKFSIREGKVEARGVTGIVDGFRWVGTIRNEKGKVKFGQAKSNYSRPMPEEIDLVRAEGGVFRVESEEEKGASEYSSEVRSEARERRETEAEEKAIATLMEQMVAALGRCQAPMTTRGHVCSLVAGRKARKEAAFARLSADGRIRKGDNGFEVSGPKSATATSRAGLTTASEPVTEPPVDDYQGDLFEEE
jgi:hypothetical protein